MRIEYAETVEVRVESGGRRTALIWDLETKIINGAELEERSVDWGRARDSTLFFSIG